MKRPRYLDPPAPPGCGLWLELGAALLARWWLGPALWIDALVLFGATAAAATWGLWAGWALAGRVWRRHCADVTAFVHDAIEEVEARVGVRLWASESSEN